MISQSHWVGAVRKHPRARLPRVRRAFSRGRWTDVVPARAP